MRVFRICALVSFTAIVFGCSSSDNPTDTPPGDTGGKDTSTSEVDIDTAVPDSKSETVKPPDAADCDGHPGDECSMVKQDCADTKQTCAWDPGTGHNVCGSLPVGTGAKGDTCDTSNPCDKGLFCYRSHCAPACCIGDSSVCGKGGTCSLSITDPGSGSVVYHVCTYDTICHPFKYDCATGEFCNWKSEPDTFACSTPSPDAKIDAKPGVPCKYVNDCGESQGCFSLSTGGADAGASQCYVFCWMDKPETFTPGTKPDGRFPADGTCTIGGTKYGTCTKITGIGGGLGLCVP